MTMAKIHHGLGTALRTAFQVHRSVFSVGKALLGSLCPMGDLSVFFSLGTNDKNVLRTISDHHCQINT